MASPLARKVLFLLLYGLASVLPFYCCATMSNKYFASSQGRRFERAAAPTAAEKQMGVDIASVAAASISLSL